MANDAYSFKEAGRRIKAALMSYQLGLKSIDRVLKHVPDDPGEEWAEIAQQLLRLMNEQAVNILAPDWKPPERNQ